MSFWPSLLRTAFHQDGQVGPQDGVKISKVLCFTALSAFLRVCTLRVTAEGLSTVLRPILTSFGLACWASALESVAKVILHIVLHN